MRDYEPITYLSVASIIGGVTAYTRRNSLPSLVASLGLGGVMAMSGMRVRDGLNYGLEGAAASSLALLIPTAKRAIATRAPIPSVIALLATATTGFYAKEIAERY